MGKIIQVVVPDNLELEDYVKLEKELKEKVEKYILLSMLDEVASKLNLTDEDLERFKETQSEVWFKYEKLYRKKGVLK